MTSKRRRDVVSNRQALLAVAIDFLWWDLWMVWFIKFPRGFARTNSNPSMNKKTWLIKKKIIFLNIVVGVCLMIRCYLAKISQKRYILHWSQFRNLCFEAPSVSENGARSAKMVCCLSWIRVMRLVICINPLRAKFFRGNINIHLHFVSFLHIDPTQVVEILPQIR